MKNINKMKIFAGLGLVWVLSLNVLHAERQVQVWVNPGMNAPNDMKEATGLDQLYYSFSNDAADKYAYVNYYDISSGSGYNAIVNVPPAPLCYSPRVGIFWAKDKEFFLYQYPLNKDSKRVEFLGSLEKYIRTAALNTVDFLKDNPVYRKYEFQKDLAAINSIPPTNHPRGLTVLEQKHTILLHLHNGDEEYFRVDNTLRRRYLPKDLVVIKLSPTLFNNLFRLAL